MLGFGTFWMRSFFLSAPRELEEAGRIDGASSGVLLWRVLLPVARPAVTTMAALFFLWSWNDFLLPLVMLSSDSRRTDRPLSLSRQPPSATVDACSIP
jgi:raffinose/stachyose/melibiose transport system permease protein